MNFIAAVAVVTGGAMGIGKSICKILLDHGSKVCIVDIDEEQAKGTCNELEEAHKGQVHFVKCDVSSIAEFRVAVEEIIEVFGKIDIVVNNAGITDENDWQKMINTNFIGVTNGIILAFEFMGYDQKGSGGCVVNIGSNAGLDPFPLAPIYSGCKHGVVGLTKSFGNDFYFTKTRVTVNCVCPGPVDTQLFHRFPEGSRDPELARKHNSKITPISPLQVAEAVIQVLNDQKNGALLTVSGRGMAYV